MSEKPATKRGRLVNALRETHREVAAVNPWKGGIDVGWIEGKLHWLCMLAEQLPSPAACTVEHEVTSEIVDAMKNCFHWLDRLLGEDGDRTDLETCREWFASLRRAREKGE